jgi:hypothetical protein
MSSFKSTIWAVLVGWTLLTWAYTLREHMDPNDDAEKFKLEVARILGAKVDNLVLHWAGWKNIQLTTKHISWLKEWDSLEVAHWVGYNDTNWNWVEENNETRMASFYSINDKRIWKNYQKGYRIKEFDRSHIIQVEQILNFWVSEITPKNELY